MDRQGSIIIVYRYHYRTFLHKMIAKVTVICAGSLNANLHEMIKFQFYLIQVNI